MFNVATFLEEVLPSRGILHLYFNTFMEMVLSANGKFHGGLHQ